MDISKRCRPGLGYPKLQKLNHGYLLSVQSRYGISQKLKRYTYGVRTCIWFIHGIACDNQRYPWYITKHWYIPAISLAYAKTRKLINWYQIPDVKQACWGPQYLLPTQKHPVFVLALQTSLICAVVLQHCCPKSLAIDSAIKTIDFKFWTSLLEWLPEERLGLELRLKLEHCSLINKF